MKPVSLWFVVESGTDVRIVDGLHERFALSIYARAVDGRVISQVSSMSLDLRVGPASRLRFALSVFFRLAFRRVAPDFILVQGYSLAALAANLGGGLAGIPVAMFVCSPTEEYYRCRLHDRDEAKPFRRHEYLLLRVLRKLNALVGRRYIVLSEYLGSVVRARNGASIEVVPLYGVDTSIFQRSAISKDELRKRRGLPQDASIVFFSSRVAPEKDAEALVHAVAHLRERGVDVRILHRSGGFRTFLEIAQRTGVEGSVIATDAVHPTRELPMDYQASDLCVQASRAEGLGFSPLEALACGVPVVAAAVGGLRETIIDGETGWTYPAGDSTALAAAIESVLTDPDEARRRAETGRNMVVEKFEREKVFERFERVVRKMIESSRPDEDSP